MRLTYSNILLENLKHNYLTIKERVSPAKIIAVVKADSYGHGMLKAVEKLETLGDNKPVLYAVACEVEGELLRESFPEVRILVFEPVHSRNVESFIKNDLIPTVFLNEHIELLAKCIPEGRSLPVHIKVDTGMNRLGIRAEDAASFVKAISSNPKIVVDGIYTHFADAENSDFAYTDKQNERFKRVLNELRDSGISYGLAHAANSGVIWMHPEAYYDAVRPGISLYGYAPSYNMLPEGVLKPVLEIKSAVESVKRLEKGESISYGRTYILPKATNIASVPIGYADGINRLLSNKMSVIINGRMYKQVGRVTMDRILIDVLEDNILPGTEVTIIGGTGEVSIDAWDWAKITGTIPYEVTCLCNNNQRIRKNYLSL